VCSHEWLNLLPGSKFASCLVGLRYFLLCEVPMIFKVLKINYCALPDLCQSRAKRSARLTGRAGNK